MGEMMPTLDAQAYPKAQYAWFAAAVLMLANLCCYIARFALFLLVQPIKHDLLISDTQISLLQGAAFSISFVVAGLPIGWLADRSKRRNILIGSVLTWSIMAVFCGLATNYGELVIARIGVGVGEAALTPAVFSFLADYFPPQQRGRAMALFYIGTPVGSGLATMGGALILRALEATVRHGSALSIAPWHLVLILSGLPGFVVALLLLAVREPARRDVDIAERRRGDRPHGRFGVLGFLAKRWRVFLPVFTSLAVVQFCAYSVGAWVMPLLVRRDGLTTPEAGLVYGVLVTSTGLFAAAFGGIIGDRLASAKTVGGRFRTVIFSYFAFAPGLVLLTATTSPWLAALGLGAVFFGVCISASVMYAVVQDIVPNQYRGQSVAILSVVVNLGSATLAPTVVALMTDLVFKDTQMVGWSILAVTLPAALIGLLANIAGLKPYTHAREELDALARPIPSVIASPA
jgi:MFS family permease